MSAKIASALHQVMSKVGYIQKTGKNAFHGYKYAGEADLLEKLRPAMVEAGLMLLPSVANVSTIDEHGNVTVHVEYTLIHKDGDVWPTPIMAAGCGNDRAKNGSVGDKGVYKAITGANKYLLFKLFQIETGDDPENQTHELPPPQTRSPEPDYDPPGEPVEPPLLAGPDALAKHVTNGLEHPPGKNKPPHWDAITKLVDGATDYTDLTYQMSQPFYKNTTSGWSNYYRRLLADKHIVPKYAAYRGSEAAIRLQAEIHAKYPLDTFSRQEAAE